MSKAFVLDAVERLAKTAIQAAAAAVLALWIDAGSFSNIDWQSVWQVAVFASGLSVLSSLASWRFGDPDSASVISSGENVGP